MTHCERTLPWRHQYHSLQSKTWSLHLTQLEIWWQWSYIDMFSFRSHSQMFCFEMNFKLLKPPWYLLKRKRKAQISWGALRILHCLRSAWNFSCDLHLCSFHRCQKSNEKHRASRKHRCCLDCTDQDYARLRDPNIFLMLKVSKRNIDIPKSPAAEGSSWVGFALGR